VNEILSHQLRQFGSFVCKKVKKLNENYWLLPKTTNYRLTSAENQSHQKFAKVQVKVDVG